MQSQQARASRAKNPIRSLSDWVRADDAALVAGLIAQNSFAQLEFIGRFGDMIDQHIAATIRRFSDALCTAEVIDEIADAVDSTMTTNRTVLRSFDPERGTLAAWVARVAEQATLRHLNELTSDPHDAV